MPEPIKLSNHKPNILISMMTKPNNILVNLTIWWWWITSHFKMSIFYTDFVVYLNVTSTFWPLVVKWKCFLCYISRWLIWFRESTSGNNLPRTDTLQKQKAAKRTAIKQTRMFKKCTLQMFYEQENLGYTQYIWWMAWNLIRSSVFWNTQNSTHITDSLTNCGRFFKGMQDAPNCRWMATT